MAVHKAESDRRSERLQIQIDELTAQVKCLKSQLQILEIEVSDRAGQSLQLKNQVSNIFFYIIYRYWICIYYVCVCA